MMAVRRRPADNADNADPSGQGVLPVELTDHASAVWRDGRLFREWCERNLPADTGPDRSQDVADPAMPAVSWVARFTVARDRWTYYHGVVRDGRPQFVGNAEADALDSSRPASPLRGVWDLAGEVGMPHRRMRDGFVLWDDELARLGCPRVKSLDRAAARHGQDLPLLRAERAAAAAREAAETGRTGPDPMP